MVSDEKSADIPNRYFFISNFSFPSGCFQDFFFFFWFLIFFISKFFRFLPMYLDIDFFEFTMFGICSTSWICRVFHQIWEIFSYHYFFEVFFFFWLHTLSGTSVMSIMCFVCVCLFLIDAHISEALFICRFVVDFLLFRLGNFYCSHLVEWFFLLSYLLHYWANVVMFKKDFWHFEII